MKLYIDDLRDPPEGWIVVRTWEEADDLITNQWEEIEAISFDHDLNDDEMTGYDLLTEIEEGLATKFLQEHPNGIPEMYCHSMNPVGRRRIQTVIDKLKKGILQRLNFHRENLSPPNK